MNKCTWSLNSPIEEHYHDTEWGIPVHDDQKLFEFLILEGAQAGLSWSTILKKRDCYLTAFDSFCAEKIARYDAKKITELLNNPGIIRNRLKVNATIGNAQAFLKIQDEVGSFNQYIWQFVNHSPIDNFWKHAEDIPTQTATSILMSQALKKREFKFVGPTICYAYMQAVGMVNDHTVDCFRHQQIIKQYRQA